MSLLRLGSDLPATSPDGRPSIRIQPHHPSHRMHGHAHVQHPWMSAHGSRTQPIGSRRTRKTGQAFQTTCDQTATLQKGTRLCTRARGSAHRVNHILRRSVPREDDVAVKHDQQHPIPAPAMAQSHVPTPQAPAALQGRNAESRHPIVGSTERSSDVRDTRRKRTATSRRPRNGGRSTSRARTTSRSRSPSVDSRIVVEMARVRQVW